MKSQIFAILLRLGIASLRDYKKLNVSSGGVFQTTDRVWDMTYSFQGEELASIERLNSGTIFSGAPVERLDFEVSSPNNLANTPLEPSNDSTQANNSSPESLISNGPEDFFIPLAGQISNDSLRSMALGNLPLSDQAMQQNVIGRLRILWSQLNISAADRDALINDMGRLAGLLAKRNGSIKLDSIDFQNYLKTLKEIFDRLVKLAEKYADRKDVQKAIQATLNSLFEQLLQQTQTIQTESRETQMDQQLFQQLLSQNQEGNMLPLEKMQNMNASVEAVLEILRRGAVNQNSTALQRSIYRKWYFDMANKSRKYRLERLHKMQTKNIPTDKVTLSETSLAQK